MPVEVRTIDLADIDALDVAGRVLANPARNAPQVTVNETLALCCSVVALGEEIMRLRAENQSLKTEGETDEPETAE